MNRKNTIARKVPGDGGNNLSLSGDTGCASTAVPWPHKIKPASLIKSSGNTRRMAKVMNDSVL